MNNFHRTAEDEDDPNQRCKRKRPTTFNTSNIASTSKHVN